MKIILLLIFLFLLTINVYSDEQLSINTFVTSPVISADEKVEFFIEASFEQNSDIDIHDIPIPRTENLVPCGQKFLSEKRSQGNKTFTILKHSFCYTPQTAGEAFIEPMSITYTQNNEPKTCVTKQIKITIHPRRNTTVIWESVAAIILIIFIAVIIFKHKKKQPVQQQEPHIEKQNIIDEQLLVCQQNLSAGEIKEFYSAVIHTIKVFCDLFFSLNVSRASVSETINQIYACNDISDKDKETLSSLLERADIIRFSTPPKDFSQNQDALKILRKCIQKNITSVEDI